MPDDAQPRPWPQPPQGTVRLRREYRDPLGRPLAGEVTITGRTRQQAGETVTAPVPVVVPLARGVLEADLPPGTYDLAVSLRSADNKRFSEVETGVHLPA